MHLLVLPLVALFVGGMYYQVDLTIGGASLLIVLPPAVLSPPSFLSSAQAAHPTSPSSTGFQSRIGALFFSGCLIAFASLSALSQFAKARRLFVRERARGCYHPLAWLATQVVFDIVPLRLVPTILLSVIV